MLFYVLSISVCYYPGTCWTLLSIKVTFGPKLIMSTQHYIHILLSIAILSN